MRMIFRKMFSVVVILTMIPFGNYGIYAAEPSEKSTIEEIDISENSIKFNQYNSSQVREENEEGVAGIEIPTAQITFNLDGVTQARIDFKMPDPSNSGEVIDGVKVVDANSRNVTVAMDYDIQISDVHTDHYKKTVMK